MPVNDSTIMCVGNYLQEDAKVEPSQTSATEFLYPADNALDMMPHRVCRFTSPPASTKTLGWQIGVGSQNPVREASTFDPGVLVLANTIDLGDPAGEPRQFLTREEYDFILATSTAVNGTYTTVGSWLGIDATASTAFMLDFSAASASLRQRDFWRLTVGVTSTSGGSNNVGTFQIGAMLLGKKYTFPENPLSGMTVTQGGFNVSIGRSTGAVTVARGWESGRVARGRVVLTTDEQADTLATYMRGAHGGTLPQWLPFFHRLNWLTAITLPTGFASSGAGPLSSYPLFGRFTRFEIQTRRQDLHVATFEFQEISAEVT